jgi:hypothetical protein
MKRIFDWLVPASTLSFKRLTREISPYWFQYHGGLLDGRQMVHLGLALRTVLPVLTSDGFIQDEIYEHEFVNRFTVEATFNGTR